MSWIIENGYPVFTDINACDVKADVIIDFAAAVAVDKLLDYAVDKQVPVVLCTTDFPGAAQQGIPLL